MKTVSRLIVFLLLCSPMAVRAQTAAPAEKSGKIDTPSVYANVPITIYDVRDGTPIKPFKSGLSRDEMYALIKEEAPTPLTGASKYQQDKGKPTIWFETGPSIAVNNGRENGPGAFSVYCERPVPLRPGEKVTPENYGKKETVWKWIVPKELQKAFLVRGMWTEGEYWYWQRQVFALTGNTGDKAEYLLSFDLSNGLLWQHKLEFLPKNQNDDLSARLNNYGFYPLPDGGMVLLMWRDNKTKAKGDEIWIFDGKGHLAVRYRLPGTEELRLQRVGEGFAFIVSGKYSPSAPPEGKAALPVDFTLLLSPNGTLQGTFVDNNGHLISVSPTQAPTFAADFKSGDLFRIY